MRWFQVGAFNPGAAAANRAIENASQRLVNNAEHAFAVFGQANLHREVAVAFDEAGGAVERIDHPDARLVETVRSVDRFFCEDAVVGKLLLQSRHDDFVGECVSLRDRLAIVGASFLLNVERAFVEIENCRACFTRQFERDRATRDRRIVGVPIIERSPEACRLELAYLRTDSAVSSLRSRKLACSLTNNLQRFIDVGARGAKVCDAGAQRELAADRCA